MLKLLPLILLLTSCQSFGIKDTDTIEQAEVKILDVINDRVEIHPEAEPPMITAPNAK